MNEFDKKYLILDETDSTNNYAKQLVEKGVAEGTVVLAQFQRFGKGQKGNSWESEAGKNLLASIVLYPVFLEAAKQFQLSKIMSLALFDFLCDEKIEVSIKWPNDIYAGNFKIAGILIENSIKGNVLSSSVIGFVLNLNQIHFFSAAPNPVSLKQLNGKTYPIDFTMEKIMEKLGNWYEKLKKGVSHEIDLAYFSRLYRNKGWHRFKNENLEFEAQIAGIGEFGQLILKNRSGVTSEYGFKEVEFLPG